jgi:hypothetical protein
MSEPMEEPPRPVPPAPSTPSTRGPVGTLRSPGLIIFLYIITLGIWGWVWSYQSAEEMKRYRGQGLGGVITLVLAIIVFPVVWFTIANEIEHLYKEDGKEPPISTIWGFATEPVATRRVLSFVDIGVCTTCARWRMEPAIWRQWDGSASATTAGTPGCRPHPTAIRSPS